MGQRELVGRIVESLARSWERGAQADAWHRLLEEKVGGILSSDGRRPPCYPGERADMILDWSSGARTPAQTVLALELMALAELADDECDELIREAEQRYAMHLQSVSLSGPGFQWSPVLHGAEGPQADMAVDIHAYVASPGIEPQRAFHTILVDCRDRGQRRTREEMEEDCGRSRRQMLAGLPTRVRYWDDEVLGDSRSCALEILRILIAALPSPRELEVSYTLARKRAADAEGLRFWRALACDWSHSR